MFRPPKRLSRSNYNEISHSLLDVDYRLEPATNYRLSTLASMSPGDFSARGHDYSLRRQLDTLSGANQPNSTTTPPDIILFTVGSAIPMADAFRGYYQARGEQVPVLHFIYADRDKSYPYFSETNTYLELSGCDHAWQAEVERLEPIVAGAGHVAIVEQLASSGRTMHYAAEATLAAGARSVTTISGAWYEEANHDGLDIPGLTSGHKGYMLDIGRCCCDTPIGFAGLEVDPELDERSYSAAMAALRSSLSQQAVTG